LRIGLIAGLIAASIGTLVGAVSAFYGGWVDTTIMRFTDILLALPYILIALAIITVVGPGERTVILVLGLLGWMAIARVLRSTILQVKESEYVDAARALGANNRRIIFRHILPNTIQPVIVYATLFIGAAVLSEAALSFLGVGVQRPTPSWGLMVNEGRRSLANYPHMLFIPAAALSILVTAAVFVGDGLRDALDPKLK
jgi:peptide/nickel transport system permease protein